MSLYERRKRQQDLARLHEECELNYQRLHRIIPHSSTLNARFSLQYNDRPSSGIKIQVIEVTKYTSTLLMIADGAGPQWLPEIEIKV